MDKSNTVFTSFVYAEAALIKSLLEASGIAVFMYDENTARLNPFYSSAIGGIKLMVPDEQVEKARDVLEEYRAKEGQEADWGNARAFDIDIYEEDETEKQDTHCMDPRLLSLLLDSWNKPLVFVDADHVIRYMNRPARRTYAKWGDVIGKSIFHCHNDMSRQKIHESFAALKEGKKEVLITDSPKHRAYMRAVRDEEGTLIGYYERYDPPSGSREADRK